MPVPSQRKYDEINTENAAKYRRKIKRLYNNAINEVAELSYKISLDKNNEFYWKNNPKLSKKVDSIISQLNYDVKSVTVSGIGEEWGLAVNKHNELATYAAGDLLSELPDAYKKKWFTNNESALNEFIKRKDNGLGLSEKIWENSKQLKYELELALEVGIKDGRSAANLSREIRTYLNEPDKLFRKVRNNQTEINKEIKVLNELKASNASKIDIVKSESTIAQLKQKGTLRLSKSAQAYSPGQGRYRSSYKNALRLSSNEINASYELSQFEKRKGQDFIVGIEIRTTPGWTSAVDKGGIICGDLAGRYPKSFDFSNKFHVNCRCQSYNVLKTRDELDNDIARILNGKEPLKRSVNSIYSKPKNYTNYIVENKEKWANWKTPPRTFTINA